MTRLLLFISMFFSIGLFAHQGSISGVVQTAGTNEPLVGAVITLENTKLWATSNALGIFEIENVPAGSYTIAVQYIGFEDFIQKDVVVRNNQTVTLKLVLKPGEIDLPSVNIHAKQSARSQTISRLDILTRPINSSQEVLRSVPGLFIAQHAGGGKAEQLFLRGFDIDHGTDVRITADGIPVNMASHAHGQGYADLHFIIPELIDNVDFNKGPYQANQGDFATAGNIAFSTKNSLDQNMVKLEAGQFNSYRMVGAFDLLGEKKADNGQSAYVAGEFNTSEGYFDSRQNFNRINVMAKYHFIPSPNQSLSVSASHFSSSWDASGQIPQRAVDQGLIGRFGAIDDTEGGSTSRQNINLIHLVQEGKSLFKNQIYYSKYDFELFSNFTFFANDPVNGDQIRQHEDRRMFGYNGSWTYESRLWKRKLISEAGLNLRFDMVDDLVLQRTKNRDEIMEDLANGSVQEMNTGFYISESLQVTDRLFVNAAIRADIFKFNYQDQLTTAYDPQSENQTVLSPKLNLQYRANDDISFYANGGYGFHSNDARVVVQQQVEQTLPKALGYDLGVVFKPFPNVVLDAAFWQLDLEQEFVYVGDEAVVEPGGATRRLGVDASLRFQIIKGLYGDVDVNYAFARTMDIASERAFIPLAPDFTSTGGLTADFASGWSGSFRYRWLGDRPANEDNTLNAEGYFLLDAFVQYKKKAFAIHAGVVNLLNSEWKEAQFETTSKLAFENEPVSEIHFTPGSPFSLRGGVSIFF